MKLERMHLLNFRCFKDLTIEFHDRLTVIVAENGAGKTALLDAVALGFGRFFSKLPGVKGHGTTDSDLRVAKDERRESFLRLAWEACTDEGDRLVWSGGRRRDAAVSFAMIKSRLASHGNVAFTQDLRPIDEYAVGLVGDAAEGRAFFLPVIAYYGTNRAIREEVQRRRGFKKIFSRFEALEGALEPDSRFRAAFEWFNAMEDEERREQVARRDFDYRHAALQTVKNAIVRILPPGVSNPRTETRPLRFVVDRMTSDGVTRTLRVGQLSDGYRVMLGLVMDLARRMAQANSTFLPDGLQIANPLDLPAIALIDEVDLHLHPGWQQHVLGDLMRTFPGTQFIVTTHSPQVLSTVPRKCIRLLGTGAGGEQIVSTPQSDTYGQPSNTVLHRVMNVDPQPPVPEMEKLKELTRLVDQGDYRSARVSGLMTDLVKILGDQHEQIQRLRRSMQRQRLLAGDDT